MSVRVTVLVPTCDRPELLAEALRSLALQTERRGFEVLVLNDGDGLIPDESIAAALELRPNMALRVLDFETRHRGQSAVLNAGLELARGTYVTVAQDDDLVLPEKLACLTAALDSAPMDVGAVYSLPQYVAVDGAPAATPPRLREFLQAHPLLTWPDVVRDGLFIHGTGTMYRRAALRAVGGWDAELPTAEEYDLHLRMLRAGWDFGAVDAVTVTYRQHPGGKSQVRSRRRGVVRRDALQRIYARLGQPISGGPEPEDPEPVAPDQEAS